MATSMGVAFACPGSTCYRNDLCYYFHMPKSSALSCPPITQWIIICLNDQASHFWLIRPSSAEAAFSSVPPVLRVGSQSRSMASNLAEGVCSSFFLLNPGARSAHLWFNSSFRTEKHALGFIEVSTHREKGWGPVKTLEFVNDRIMEAFPDALSFSNQNKLMTNSLSHDELNRVVNELIEMALAIDEARQIATATPDSPKAPRISRI